MKDLKDDRKLCYSQERRRMLGAMGALAGIAGAGWLGIRPAQAATDWPNKPIRIVVPYAAGQGADVLTRLVADNLSQSLGQPIVVENRAGAGGNIGTAAVARSTGDGYTFLLGTNATHAANEFLYPDPGFKPEDFAAVAMIGLLPMVICTTAPDLPENGIAALIEKARKEPDTLNVGLPSTTAQVVFSEFVRSANAPLFAVRYKASAQSMTDVMGGQIPLVIDTVTAARPHIQSGRLKALGITSLRASDMLPGIQPVSEQGVNSFDVVAWDAFFAPRSTPPEIIERFSAALGQAMADPALQQRMRDIGVEPLFMPPNELATFVKGEREKWGGIIREANISLG